MRLSKSNNVFHKQFKLRHTTSTELLSQRFGSVSNPLKDSYFNSWQRGGDPAISSTSQESSLLGSMFSGRERWGWQCWAAFTSSFSWNPASQRTVHFQVEREKLGRKCCEEKRQPVLLQLVRQERPTCHEAPKQDQVRCCNTFAAPSPVSSNKESNSGRAVEEINVFYLLK